MSTTAALLTEARVALEGEAFVNDDIDEAKRALEQSPTLTVFVPGKSSLNTVL